MVVSLRLAGLGRLGSRLGGTELPVEFVDGSFDDRGLADVPVPGVLASHGALNRFDLLARALVESEGGSGCLGHGSPPTPDARVSSRRCRDGRSYVVTLSRRGSSRRRGGRRCAAFRVELGGER